MTETLPRGHAPAGHAFHSPASYPRTPAAAAPSRTVSDQPGLTAARGTALYIGALLGPGLLLLPGLAAAEAGPASVLAWAGLITLSGLFAVVFGSLGRGFPSAGGVIGYVRAGLGERASAIAGWSFLAGVIAGAPVVCLIGAGYITELAGDGSGGAGRGTRALVAGVLLLVGLLLGVVVIAVTGSAHAARAANWTPFAPHGWQAVGHAASTLMLSFVGWEAVAPLTTRFADPSRQLPRVIGSALLVTSVLYLGLAVATISVLGPGAGISAPLAALLRDAAGPSGTVAAAVAAVVLTLGAVNAYVTGAAAMAVELTRPGRVSSGARPGTRPTPRFLAAIAGSGLALISLYGLGLASPAALVAIPTTLFLAVYLGCMSSAVRVLRGRARLAAAPAAVIVAVVLAYCGWALIAPLAVIIAVCSARPLGRSADLIRKRYESR